ncbi:MAG: geranylgeranyl reductase family protein [Candidatus Jordarchaeum sp.]|uniref:geranylgeranyl reductase family protein n=1 Tax=Candidatus Jordarchaeum sp. TaxID=2823881 RepID=UPI004049710D
MIWDVIVVGGGPAGLICSENLASYGLNVLVLDDRDEPNMDKLCGGMLTERALREFSLDENILEREIWGVTVSYREGESFTIDYDERVGGNVHRTELGKYLAQRAVSNGAEVRSKEHVKKLKIRQDYVELSASETYQTKMVAGADGVNSIIKKLLNPMDDRKSLGFCVQYLMSMKPELIDERFGKRNEFYYGGDVSPFGYAWIFPKGDCLAVGVGALLSKVKENLKTYLENFVKNHPVASQKLEGAKVIRFDAALVPLSGLTSINYSDRIVLVGDAAGTVSPITGEGMYYSMVSGKIAADVINRAFHKNDFSEKGLSVYQKKLKKRLGSELKWGVWLQNYFLKGQSSNVGIGIMSDKGMQKLVGDLLVGRKSYTRILVRAIPYWLKNKIRNTIRD